MTAMKGGTASGRLIEGFDAVASCLRNAESVNLHIGTTRYFGSLEKWIQGKAIVFKLSSLDNDLVKVPNGFSQVKLNVVGRDKATNNFPTRIISKKLPRLLLHFPDREEEKTNRLHKRIHTNISTPIILKKRAYDLRPMENTGMGTVENISEGGCSMSTTMDLKVGDIINFFIPGKSGEKPVDIELNGIVRNQDRTPGGMMRIGVQYMKLDRKAVMLVSAYMARRFRQADPGLPGIGLDAAADPARFKSL